MKCITVRTERALSQRITSLLEQLIDDSNTAHLQPAISEPRVLAAIAFREAHEATADPNGYVADDAFESLTDDALTALHSLYLNPGRDHEVTANNRTIAAAVQKAVEEHFGVQLSKQSRGIFFERIVAAITEARS
jgi:alpha-D-ribose 1-methylphosphonate 5-triphosphate synthase subunit PhnH